MTDIKTEALSLILSLIIIVAVIFTATRCSKSTLEPKQEKHKYNTETYKDDEVIYKIITDRAGDVIYCEPME